MSDYPASPRLPDHGTHVAELRDDPRDRRGQYSEIPTRHGLVVVSHDAPGALIASLVRERMLG